MQFIYVKLPVGSRLEGREHIFHDGLESALTARKVGSVLGWGGSLSRVNASEAHRLAFHRVDIEVTDSEPARSLLQRTLLALDAPLGTEIHYAIDGNGLLDVFSLGGWRTEPCISGTQRRTKSAGRLGVSRV